MKYYLYEDLEVGQSESFDVVITESMIESFKIITGDVNPLHTNGDFARNNHFHDKVVYGMLTASFLSTLAGCYLPGERSLIHSVETKFIKPVFVGDSLNVKGTVAELNDTVKQIILKVEIRNQHNEKVLRGKMSIGLLTTGMDGGE